MSPACDRHQPLVDRVLEGTPTDADLDAYAEEVPTCADCRQELVLASGVLPSVLDQGGRVSAEEAMPDPAMARLARVLPAESSPRRWPYVAGGLLAAAVGLFALAPFAAPTASWVAPAPVQTAVADPAAPEMGSVEDAAAPSPEVVVEPVPPAPVAPPTADEPPLPDWEPSTAGTPKGSSQTLSLALVLGNPSPQVGEVVPLTVTASRATPATLCVSGVEEGVVWRGDLPVGRTALSTDGQPIGFAFEQTGAYRFALATADDPACGDPVQRVLVEVGP